jgi:Ca2+-binding EF-hand superfamily protein
MGCSSTKGTAAHESKHSKGPPQSGSAADADTTITLLKSLFSKIDLNADGRLDAKELAKALKEESSLEQMLEKAGYNSHYYVLEQLDSNQDGAVSWDEFKVCLTSKADEGAAKNQADSDAKDAAINLLKSLFGKVDADANGKLDAKELAAALRSEPFLAKVLEQAGLNSQFYVLEQLDSNNDGTVSWDEFKECLESSATTVGKQASLIKDAMDEAELPNAFAPPEEGPKIETIAAGATKSGCWCF